MECEIRSDLCGPPRRTMGAVHRSSVTAPLRVGSRPGPGAVPGSGGQPRCLDLLSRVPSAPNRAAPCPRPGTRRCRDSRAFAPSVSRQHWRIHVPSAPSERYPPVRLSGPRYRPRSFHSLTEHLYPSAAVAEHSTILYPVPSRCLPDWPPRPSPRFPSAALTSPRAPPVASRPIGPPWSVTVRRSVPEFRSPSCPWRGD